MTLYECLWEPGHSVADPFFKDVTYPWEILDRIPEIIERFIRDAGGTGPGSVWKEPSPGIYLHESVDVHPTAILHGPLLVGAGSVILPHAYVRGRVIAGREVTIGHTTELKGCILFDEVEVPHFNYVGDGILGHGAHLGAGAICSNLRADKQTVTVRIPGPSQTSQRISTGRRKFSCLLGDHVEVGCHAVLNPGSIVGHDAVIYPLTSVTGYTAPGALRSATERSR